MKKLNQILSMKSWSCHAEIHVFFHLELKILLEDYLKNDLSVEFLCKFINIRSMILQHINYETNVVYPVFKREITLFLSYGKPNLFEDDHKKLKSDFNNLFLSFFLDEKKVILFNYYQFLDLLDHHDTREVTALYPLLEKHLSSESCENILAEFSKHIQLQEIETIRVPITFFIEFILVWNQFILTSFISEQLESKKKLIELLNEYDVSLVTKKLKDKLVDLIEAYHFSTDILLNIKGLRQCESVLKALIKQMLLNNAETLDT